MRERLLWELSEVFERFEALEVDNASIVLFNKDCALGFCESDILKRYCYVVRSFGKACSGSKKKFFFAERYGGSFISKNGGGGRCGYDGLFQSKGIGKTPLVDLRGDTFHSNGMLDLESAIHELIWGEVIHLVLPYGAARSIAVIKLNENFVLDGETYKRTLLVREAVLRPAHFERATLFKEKFSSGASLSNDAVRVKKAIQRINEFLPGEHDVSDSEFSAPINIDSVRSGIINLATRFAEQFAVARCKNIMHMMMSSSNLTMGGGWLDLNSVTIVSPMSVTEKRLFRQFENEHFPVIKSLEDICFYIGKYLPLSAEFAGEMLSDALEGFKRCYELTLRKNALVRGGFPQYVVEKMVESEEFKRLSDLLIRLMRRQSYELGVEQIFGGLLFYSLSERPNVSSYTINNGLSNIIIDWRVSDIYLRSELDEAFQLFLNAVLNKTEVSRVELIRLVCINLTRYSRTPVFLQNIKLYELLKLHIREAESDRDLKVKLSSLMCDAKDAAEICLSIDKGFTALVWKSGDNYVEYDGVVGQFCVVREGRRDFLTWAELVSLTNNLSLARYTVDFYDAVRGAFLEI
ncbi:hypothetical protein [Pseudomonas fluorescens]|uniref:MchC protein n=1 Tax=Pseudomonas fluorescens TaxID=294 RepID=A0A5E7F0P9_PSEFL|nr:hypothetical protein [Pseudomonas fluorescens]VVO32352.1 hypothetical protein PS710_05138 [Pseudomonas fluorescens]